MRIVGYTRQGLPGGVAQTPDRELGIDGAVYEHQLVAEAKGQVIAGVQLQACRNGDLIGHAGRARGCHLVLVATADSGDQCDGDGNHGSEIHEANPSSIR